MGLACVSFAREDLVAGMVPHSRHVGRRRPRHDHLRNDVEVACGTRKETRPRSCSQDIAGVADVLENHARHEGRSDGRPVYGHPQSCPCPTLERWSEGETVRLVKTAWRHGYRGLACIIAVAWDTQFSPVDVRTLAARHRTTVGGRLIFDRLVDGRTKTGRAAIGTVSPRTERLVSGLP